MMGMCQCFFTGRYSEIVGPRTSIGRSPIMRGLEPGEVISTAEQGEHSVYDEPRTHLHRQPLERPARRGQGRAAWLAPHDAVSARGDGARESARARRRDFFLYIDEFHNFTTDAFASILAEARKYRLCLSLSHQYIDQLPLPVRQAVLGNVGTLVSFRIGNTDAEVLSREFGETFPPANFVDIDRYEVLVRLMENGANPAPFRARTLAPVEQRIGKRETFIARSREKYATRRSNVDAKIKRWSF